MSSNDPKNRYPGMTGGPSVPIHGPQTHQPFGAGTFANVAFGSAQLSQDELAVLRDLLQETAEKVEERVDEQFFHPAVAAPRARHVPQATTRAQDLLSEDNFEIQRAVRTELINVVLENSRKFENLRK